MVSHQKNNPKKPRKAKIFFLIVGIVVGTELLVQIIWPTTILTPNTIIDDENFGLWDKSRAVSMLDNIYNGLPVEIFFGDNTESYVSSTMSEAGLSVSNARRVNQIDYPAHLRLVPTSLFWYGFLNQVGLPQTSTDEAVVNNFIIQNFNDKSRIEPVDAGLVVTEQSIDLKKSQIGGDFSLSELKEAIGNPTYLNRKAIVKVDIMPEYPKVNDEQALKVATTVSGQLIDDLVLAFDDYNEKIELSVDTIREWITFEVVDRELMPIINEKKLNKFLETEVAPLVEKAAGTTTITTSDLAGFDRKEGDEGKVINTVETGWRLTEYLLGKRQSVVIAVESIDPTVEYVYERISSNNEQQDLVEDEDDEELEELESESLV